MFDVIDLTRHLSERSLSYPGDRPGLTIGQVDTGDPDCRVSHLSHLDLHVGTHLDAPLHFDPHGTDILGLGLRLLPLRLVVCSDRWIGPEWVPDEIEGHALLFHTGWTPPLSRSEYFKGFPGLTPEAARRIVEGRPGLIGLDTPSADPPEAAPEYPAHRILLGGRIPIVEGLTNLRSLPVTDGTAWFGVFPLAIEGAEGAPARAVAFVESPPSS